jgi:hypothetical protein
VSDTDGEWADRDIPDDPEDWQQDDSSDSYSGEQVTFQDRAAEAAGQLEAVAKGDKPQDFDDILGPRYWPRMSAAEAATAWTELRRWVDELLERFSHLDHHVIPMCWWRHNGHVEALSALRDHQRMCYDDSSPPTAAMEWHRAFRDIEARLREWTSTLACGATHDPRGRPVRVTDENEWDQFVATDFERRARNQGQQQEEPAAAAQTTAEQKEQD